MSDVELLKEIALLTGKMALKAALTVQLQIAGSFATALQSKGILTNDETAAMLTDAAEGLRSAIRTPQPTNTDITVSAFAEFIEQLLTVAETARKGVGL